jgi:hypothetical protein
METEHVVTKSSKGMIWTGRVLSLLPVLLLLMSSFMALSRNPMVVKSMTQQYGYPDNAVVPIGIAALTCAILYAIPQTAVLGAILLTGYLGGATATHVRAGEPFILPPLVGVVVWLGIFLRDRRLRALVPWRCLKK